MSANVSLAAWGARAVECRAQNGRADCADTMGDGTGGSAGVCLYFAAGAVGGAMPAEGWYCACAEFRSGVDCASVDPLAYAVVASQLGQMTIVAWMIWFARETRGEISSSGKAGMQLPKRLTLLVECCGAVSLISSTLNIALLVAPVPYWDVAAVQEIFNSLTSGLLTGAGGVLLVSFRTVVQATTTGQSPPAWEARAADLFAVVVFAATLATPLTVKSLVALFMGLLVIVPTIALGFKIKRMIDDMSNVTRRLSTKSQAEFTAALKRIMRLLKHGRLFLLCFVATRVAVATVAQALAPVQGMTAAYAARLVFLMLRNLSVVHILTQIVSYVGGAARLSNIQKRSRIADSSAASAGTSSSLPTWSRVWPSSSAPTAGVPAKVVSCGR